MDQVGTIILAMELTKRLRNFRCEGEYDSCFSLVCDTDENIVVDLDRALDSLKATKQRNVTKMRQAKQDKVSERRDKVLSFLQAGMSEDDMAAELDVSVRTIQRDISALNGQVKVTS